MHRSLAILFTIARRADRDRFISFFEQENVPIGLRFLGQGTASRELLSFLGVGETDKVILMSVLSRAKARRITQTLDIALKMDQPGAVAFTVPLHSLGALHVMETIFGGCISNPDIMDQEVDHAMDAQKESHLPDEERILYELIIVIANKGFVGLVMEAAREAGASGGTTIHAGGTRDAKNDSFGRVSLQNEKDIIWILVDADKRIKVMKAIMENAAEANAMQFSIPVTDTAGLHKH